MAIDLIGQLKQSFDGDAVRALGTRLDESPDRIEQALAMGGPAILAGLVKALADPHEGARVVDALRNEPSDIEGVDAPDLGDLIRGGPFDAVVGHGQDLLRTILGERLGRVMDLIADDSGARPTSIAALLGLLAPAIAALLRRATGPGGPSLDALIDILAGQGEAVSRQAPVGLAEALGLQGVSDLETPPVAPASEERVAVAVRPAATTGRVAPRVMMSEPGVDADQAASLTRWAVAATLGLLVLAGTYYLLPRDAGRFDLPDDKAESPPTNRPAIVATRDDADAAPAPAEAPATLEGRPVVETTSRVVSIALPGDLTIEAPEGSYIESMILTLRDGGIAESRTFVAGDLTFDADDKLAAESSLPIGRIARVAEGYPKLRLKVNGRESLQDAKPVVSREQARHRAEAVRDALIAAGVPADRVGIEVVAPNLPAEHPAAIAEADVPISISIVAE